MLYLAKSVEIYQQILDLFNNDTEETFNKVSLEVFMTQATHNPTYRRFLSLINCDARLLSHYSEIPLMPISFFKMHEIKTHNWSSEKEFLSSGTIDTQLRSQHHIKKLSWYNQIAYNIFQYSKGNLEQYEVLALLPSYLENGDSSLVHMVSHFQHLSKTDLPASFLYNHDDLAARIEAVLDKTNKPILLFGVTYALLDFASQYHISSDRLEIIFTGGMKKRKKEMTYEAVKAELSAGFPISKIYAEYGMTELLSQAYSNEDSTYHMPPTMRVVTKELQDPRANCKSGKAGMVGVLDLANCDSCSFILTEDLGLIESERNFQILGRLQDSDLRGCNLLYNPELS